MSEIKDQAVQVFLDQLASKASTPGGGSAAAVMGAQSAALISMVCNLTIGKAKYAEVEADMQVLLVKSEAMREELTGMIKADVHAFNKVMAAYGMPKDSEAHKLKRSEEIQAALKEAADVPLACARSCAQIIEISREAAEKGNSNLVSDAGVAVMAAYAALKSAALNVYINVNSLHDKNFAEQQMFELEQILNTAEIASEEIYEQVKSKILTVE